MKLHLPLGLRRALYHTFIAILTGAAALANSTFADCKALPDEVAEGKAAVFDDKSGSGTTTLRIYCTHADMMDGINILPGTFVLPPDKTTLVLRTKYEEIDMEGHATMNGSLTVIIDEKSGEYNPFNLHGYTLTMGSGTTLDTTGCYYGIYWESGSIVSDGTVHFLKHYVSQDSMPEDEMLATMSGGALTITWDASNRYTFTDKGNADANTLSLTTGNLTLVDDSLGALHIESGQTVTSGVETMAVGALSGEGTLSAAGKTVQITAASPNIQNNITAANLGIYADATLKADAAVTVSQSTRVAGGSTLTVENASSLASVGVVTVDVAAALTVTKGNLEVVDGGTIAGAVTTKDGSIALTGAAVTGALSASENVSLTNGSLTDGVVSASEDVLLSGVSTSGSMADVTAGGTLQLAGNTAYTLGGKVTAATLDVDTDTTLSGGVDVSGSTEIAAGKTLALDGVAAGSLGEVKGAEATLDLDNSTVTTAAVTVAALHVDATSSLTASTGDVTATGGSIDGSVKADGGSISLTAAAVKGTLKASEGMSLSGGTTSAATLVANTITLSGTQLSGANNLTAANGTVTLDGVSSAGAGIEVHAATLAVKGTALSLVNNGVNVGSLDLDTSLNLTGGSLVASSVTLAEGKTLTLTNAATASLGKLSGEGTGAYLKLDGTIATAASVSNIAKVELANGGNLYTYGDLDALNMNLVGATATGQHVVLREGSSYLNGSVVTATGSLTILDPATELDDSTANDGEVLFSGSVLASSGPTMMEENATLHLTSNATGTFGAAGITGKAGSTLLVDGSSQLASDGAIDVSSLTVGAGGDAAASTVTARSLTVSELGVASSGKVSASGDVSVTGAATVAGEVNAADIELGAGSDVSGSLSASDSITLEGQVSGTAAVLDAGKTLDLTAAELKGTGTSLTAGTLLSNTTTAQTLTEGHVSVSALQTGAGLILSGNKSGTVHSLGDVTGGTLVLASDANVATTATAEKVTLSTLLVNEGSKLAADTVRTTGAGSALAGEIDATNDVELNGATVTGTVDSELGSVRISGTVSGAAALSATKGRLELSDAELAVDGGSLSASSIVLNASEDSTVTNGTVTATESLNVGQKLTLSGGDAHNLAAVTGKALVLKDATALADSVALATLEVDADSSLSAKGTVATTGAATIGGKLASTAGDISLGAGSGVAAGASVEADGTLTMAGGTSAGSLSAADYVTTGDVNISGGKLNFSTTTVGAGTSLDITGVDAASELGAVLVAGAGTSLQIGSDTVATSLKAEVKVENQGALVLTGSADADSVLDGSMTLSGESSATLTNAKVSGDVTLKGMGDALTMDDSVIGGKLTVSSGSSLTLTDANQAGSLLLSDGAILTWNAGATLTLGSADAPGSLVVDGASTANIGREGLTGDISLLHGTVNMEQGAAVHGDITMAPENSNDTFRALNVQDSFTMDADTTLTVEGSNNVITVAKSLQAEDLAGAGQLQLTGDGSVSFVGDGSTHSGNMESSLGGTLSATAANSLGTSGTLSLLKKATLLITAAQAKNISIAEGTTTTLSTTGAADAPVELSGNVTGDTLALVDADVTLSGTADKLAQVTVDEDSSLTTTNGGSYAAVANSGVINMSGADIGSLVNDSEASTPSVITGGSIGDVENKAGELTLDGTSLKAHAVITNADTLTLTGVKNVAGQQAAAMSNAANASLTVDGGSQLKVTDATLNGTVNVSGGSTFAATESMVISGTATVADSTLAATHKMTVSGSVTLGESSADATAQLSAGMDGMEISGTVSGTGDVISAGDVTVKEGGTIGTTGAPLAGDVSAGDTLLVAGGLDVEGGVTAESLVVTGSASVTGEVTADTTRVNGGSLSISGDGDVAGSALGEAIVSAGGDLTLENDTFSGSLQIVGTGTKGETSASLSDATFAGDIAVEDAGTLNLSNTAVRGDVTLEGEGDTLNLNASTISGTLSVGNGSLVDITGANRAGELVLDDGSVLTWNEGATLELGTAAERGSLVVDGNSTANINNDGLTGDVNLIHGTVNIEPGGGSVGDQLIKGNITMGALDYEDAERNINVEDSFAMQAGSSLTINDSSGSNSIHVANSMVVENLMGGGDVAFAGTGDVTFQGSASEHTGDIASTLTGTISATKENSLGLGGTLTLSSAETKVLDAEPDLQILADQAKNIEVDKQTVTITTTADDGTMSEVTLSGVLSSTDDSYTLALDDASLTLTHADNELERVTVDADSSLTTTNGGSYGSVDNSGTISMTGAAIGSLTSNSTKTSSVTDGSIETLLDNQAGTLTVSGTTLKAGAEVTNSGVLTLSSVSNETDVFGTAVPAGDLTNTEHGTLTLEDSELLVASSTHAGDTTLKNSTLSSVGTTDVSGTVALENSTLASGEEGSSISGEVTGTGSLTSEGTVDVTGRVDLDGTVEAVALTTTGSVTVDGTVKVESLTAEQGAAVSITGDGTLGDSVGSALGEASVDASTLTLAADDVAGNVTATNGSSLSLDSVAFSGAVNATGSDVELTDSDITGSLAAQNEGTANSVTLSGSNTLAATEASSIAGAIDGDGTLAKSGSEMLSLSGSDANPATKGSYRIEVAGGGITLDNTLRNGTLKAGAGEEVLLSNGQSSMGAIEFVGTHQAAHNTSSAAATHLVIEQAAEGTAGDYLSSATGEALNANGAQLHVTSFVSDSGKLDDSTADMLVGEGITGFDKEIVYGGNHSETNFNLVEKDGNSYIDVSVSHVGADKNDFQQGVSDAIVDAAGAGGRLGELVEALNHTTSEQEALNALNQIGGAGIATTMAAQMSANRDHMRTLRGSIGQPASLPYESYIGANVRRATGTAREHEHTLRFPTRLWGMMTGSSSNLDSDSKGGVGYKRHDLGFLVGSDVTLSNRALVGLSAGYSRSNVEAINQTASGDQYYVDVYGRLNTQRVSQSFTFGVGFFDWNLNRSVMVRTADLYKDFAGTSRGQAKGMALNFSYEIAYNFRMKANHSLAPVFQLESTFNHIGGYREKGGDLGNAGLDVNFDNTFNTTLGLGLRYAYGFNGFGSATDKGVIAARAMLIGEVGDVNGTMRSGFIGGSRHFECESTKASRTGILVGVDTLVPVSEHWALFGNCSFEIRDEYRDVSAGAGVRYSF